MSWEPVIGLEIHVHLKTRTKMFCRCPVAVLRAAEHADVPGLPRAPGLAAGAEPRRRSSGRSCSGSRSAARSPTRAVFHRKNYFYPGQPQGLPDLPVRRAALRGRPLRRAGARRRRRGRDRARAPRGGRGQDVHVGGAEGRIHGAERSLVDFNRAGTPLVEIVTAPDLRSAEEAKRFLQLLRQTVVELGISDAEMEKGSLRFDVNVSVRAGGRDELAHAHRAEEHELVQLRREGDRARDPAADRDLRVRRRGRAGDAPLRSRQRVGAAAALEGGGAGLPLLPGAGPRAARARPRAGRAAARRSCRSRRAARIGRLEAEVGFALAEGLVTSGRDELYSRIPGEREAVAQRRHERARGGRRRSGERERGGARRR